ncbi:MAG: ROK family protein, partial [Erysipelotrichaceae bacterium]
TFFDGQEIEAFGLGCFGPIDLNLNSETYGFITTTPKPGWNNFNIVGAIKERYSVPVGFDTDVNGAALGESQLGSSNGLDNVLYLTIGTGIGGGAVVEGKLVHGMLHPEMGHFYLQKREDDHYQGNCPYHKSCLEGLASGVAIEKRWGIKASELPKDHPAWDLEAYYLAQAIVTYITVLSPEKIILGGGVMHQTQLFPLIHHHVLTLLNGYIQTKQLTPETIQDYIVAPSLNDDSGLKGALMLGKQARY